MPRLAVVAIVGLMFIVAGGLVIGTSALHLFESGPDPNDGQTASWPPVIGQPYPDWEFLNTDGQFVRLSSFRGKIVVVELIGLPCKACQAMSGGHWRGGFGGVQPQKDIVSLDELFPKYAQGIKLSDPRIVNIQLLLYDMDGSDVPSLEMARRWEKHFALDQRSNTHVLIGNRAMLSPRTRKMIPGVHLIDASFKLRLMAGNPPFSDLYTQVLPMVPRIITDVEQQPDVSQPDVSKTPE